jgi:hypothetical protein
MAAQHPGFHQAGCSGHQIGGSAMNRASTALAANYQASPIKRFRSTKAAVEARRSALLDIVANMRPMTVRQVFYQATMKNIVEKSEAGYTKVQTDLTLMRRSGDLPYGWLTDSTSAQASREPSTASMPRSSTPQYSIAKTCGRPPTATSRCGLRRTRWPESSTRSPPRTTCR